MMPVLSRQSGTPKAERCGSRVGGGGGLQLEHSEDDDDEGDDTVMMRTLLRDMMMSRSRTPQFAFKVWSTLWSSQGVGTVVLLFLSFAMTSQYQTELCMRPNTQHALHRHTALILFYFHVRVSRHASQISSCISFTSRIMLSGHNHFLDKKEVQHLFLNVFVKIH